MLQIVLGSGGGSGEVKHFCKEKENKCCAVHFHTFFPSKYEKWKRKVLIFFWLASIVLEIEQVTAAYVKKNNAGLGITGTSR